MMKIIDRLLRELFIKYILILNLELYYVLIKKLIINIILGLLNHSFIGNLHFVINKRFFLINPN